MSQSEAHRELVIQVAERIALLHPQISIVSDLQQFPGDAVPPMINGFRPDVYATLPEGAVSTIIAEAKTDGDLDNSHTDQQLSAFIRHLEQKEDGCFILAVSGRRANHAKTLLRFARLINNIASTKLVVFDSCDFWQLDALPSTIWRLL